MVCIPSFFFLSSSDLSVNERNQWMNQKGVFSQVLLFHCSLSFFILFMDGFLVLKFWDKWLWTLNDCLWCFHIYFVEKAGENLEETFCCYFFSWCWKESLFKKKKRNYCGKTFSPSSSCKLSSKRGSMWLNHVNIFPTLAWSQGWAGAGFQHGFLSSTPSTEYNLQGKELGICLFIYLGGICFLTNILDDFLWSSKFGCCMIQFSSVAQSCPTLCDPMNCSTPGLPVYHQLPESTQTHVHSVGDAIQPSHPLSSPSPPVLSLSQHQGLFKWVSSPHQVAKVLEFQLQHQSFQWTPRADLL